MDKTSSITIQEKRKRGKHLIQEERGMIQVLHSQGLTLRAIAEYVGCAHTTVYYELRRGTPVKKSARGRQPVYTAKRGQAAYEEHRKNCRSPLKLATTVAEAFIQELSTAVREESASIDEFIGRVKLESRYAPNQILCTKSIYNMLHRSKLPFTVFDVPQLLNRKKHRNWTRKLKRLRGTSIDQRPKKIAERLEISHWEADTVIGHREGKESCVFTLVEMVTHKYIAIKISYLDAPPKEYRRLWHSYDGYTASGLALYLKALPLTMVLSSKTSISTRNATGRRYTLRIRSPHGNARRTNVTTRCCVSTCRKVNLLTNIQRMRYCAWPIR